MKSNTFIDWLYDAALFVAIVGAFLLFVNYGLGLLYPAPDYDDFCGEENVAVPTENLTKKQCEAVGGKWYGRDNTRPIPAAEESSAGAMTATSGVEESAGYCQRDYQCRQAYEAVQDQHDRNAFAILSVLGLLVAMFGLGRRSGRILNVSLSAAGILLVLVSTARFWNGADDWSQFGLLFVALVVFIYFAYKREQDE